MVICIDRRIDVSITTSFQWVRKQEDSGRSLLDTNSVFAYSRSYFCLPTLLCSCIYSCINTRHSQIRTHACITHTRRTHARSRSTPAQGLIADTFTHTCSLTLKTTLPPRWRKPTLYISRGMRSVERIQCNINAETGNYEYE